MLAIKLKASKAIDLDHAPTIAEVSATYGSLRKRWLDLGEERERVGIAVRSLVDRGIRPNIKSPAAEKAKREREERIAALVGERSSAPAVVASATNDEGKFLNPCWRKPAAFSFHVLPICGIVTAQRLGHSKLPN